MRTLLPKVKLILLRRAPFELAFSTFHYNRGKLQSAKNADRLWPLVQLARKMGSSKTMGRLKGDKGGEGGRGTEEGGGGGSSSDMKDALERIAHAVDDGGTFSSRSSGSSSNSSSSTSSSAPSQSRSFIREAASEVFKTFSFDDWLFLFAFEVEACLRCRPSSPSSSTSPSSTSFSTSPSSPSFMAESDNDLSAECALVPQLTTKLPTLFRHHEDLQEEHWRNAAGSTAGAGKEEEEEGRQNNNNPITDVSLGGRLSPRAQCWFPPATHHLNFFARSAFERQLNLYRTFFPRPEQLLVLDSTDLFTETQQTLDAVLRFLGLPPHRFDPHKTLGVKLQGPPRFLPPSSSPQATATLSSSDMTITASQAPGEATVEAVAAATAQGTQKAATDHKSASEASRRRFAYLSCRLEHLAGNTNPGLCSAVGVAVS
jgi:hypothetical protein